uniref:Uncharacterized protein n=1 Tax=uncultured bacterium contig00003 TaxID=1181495 RepID=A0A806KN79_9BACT|nr:hypothetical protein [uncultured bacterium contig00003]
MTLSGRNAFFRVGIALCAISSLLILAVSFLLIPAYPNMEENTRRPADFFQVLIGKFLKTSYFAVHTSMIMVVLFSLIGIILIFYYFEQTSAPEILYIAFFTVSFSFETIRFILPLQYIYDIPSFYMLIASRALLFARYFGIFSLVTASICAAGLEVQMTRNAIMIIIIATLAIVGVPIDTQSWDTGFNAIHGFNNMFRLIEIAAFFSIVVSFFIAVHVRGSKEYAYIGIGFVIALVGRYFLLYFDNWAGPVPGILMLSFGMWFVCSKLHRIYLWL